MCTTIICENQEIPMALHDEGARMVPELDDQFDSAGCTRADQILLSCGVALFLIHSERATLVIESKPSKWSEERTRHSIHRITGAC